MRRQAATLAHPRGTAAAAAAAAARSEAQSGAAAAAAGGAAQGGALRRGWGTLVNVNKGILVGGLEHFLFFHILGIIIPVD